MLLASNLSNYTYLNNNKLMQGKNYTHYSYKAIPAFKGVIVTDITDFSISKSQDLKKENIPKMVQDFTDSLMIGAKNGKLSIADANMLMMVHASGLPIEVKDVKSLKGIDEGTVAFCYPEHDKEGNLQKTYLFMNFDMPVSKTAKSLAHEFTHCLQFNTKEAKEMMKELIPADNGTNNYFNAFRMFERHLQDNNIHRRVDENVVTIGTMLSILADKMMEPLKAFNFNNKGLQKEYDEVLEQALEKFQIDNKDLALRYFKFRLSLEAEAYKNGANAIKQYVKLPQTQAIPNDLISKMYTDCVQYMDSKIQKA